MRAKVKIATVKIIDIRRRYRTSPTEPGVDIVTHTHIVNAGQQCVIQGTGGECALQLGINREILQFFIIVNVLTSQRVIPI